MAGRGRGRGSQFSAIQDSLGIGRERVENQSLNDPPPIYPPLKNKPHRPLKDQEQEYMLAVMKDFVNQMRDSQFALQKPSVKTIENRGIQIGRLHDKVEPTQKPLTGIDWKRYPKELAPNSRKAKKRTKSSQKPKLVKTVKTEDLLKKLEEAEKSDKMNENKEEDEKSEASDNEDKDEDKEDEEDQDDQDEEMDDGGDYDNNYFDNGEGYLDEEDDNLDEGGIY